MKKLRKIILRIFLFSSLGLIVLGISAILLSRVYEKELKDYVINRIDEKFSARIDVEVIDLSFWRKFPHASLRFRNIIVTDNHIPGNPPILVAKNLFLQFNIKDIIKQKFILRKIEVTDGKIDIMIYQGGKNNFDLFQESADTTGSFFLSANNFLLKNMIISYENQSTAQYFEVEAKKMELPFSINNTGLKTGLKGNAAITVLRSEGVDILNNIDCEINSGLAFDNATQTLTIDPSGLSANGIPLNVSGYFQLIPDKIATELIINTENLPLSAIIDLLPKDIFSSAIIPSKKGFMNANLSIKGNLGGKKIPSISGDFSINDASLSIEKKEIKIDKLSLNGSFTNGKTGGVETTSLKINQINGLLNGKAFSGSLGLKNLRNPILNLALDAKVDLAEIHEIFQISFFEIMEGNADLNINFSGKPQDITSINSLKNSKLYGNYKLLNGKLKISGQDIIYSKIDAQGKFNPLQFSLSKLSLLADENQITANGSITNYLDLFTSETNNTLRLDLTASTNYLSFEKLMNMISIETEDQSSGNELSLMAHIGFKADIFDYDNIRLENTSGIFQYFDGEWSIQNAIFKLDDGQFKGSVVSKPGNSKNSLYFIDGHFNSLNIQKVFSTFNNFDQDIITNKNINGIADGNIRMQMAFDKDGNLIKKSLIAKTDFIIKNGQLNNVDQLNSLSSFTRIDDFSKINFSTLSNSISIENEIISIPKMQIKSDKMDLELYGTHNFKNEYDYHLNVLVSDVLGRKVEKTTENEFGIIEDDGSGKTRLFLRIIGTGDKFEVKFDRKEVSAKISQDLKTESQEIKTTLKTEFINPERDSLRKAKKTAKEAEMEKLKRQENGEFIIEWDDSDTTDIEF